MSFDHPAFAPYRQLVAELALSRGLPSLDALNAAAAARDIRNAAGRPLRFVESNGRLSARAYETAILQTGAVPMRSTTWHDVLNALVWLRFPQFKGALNAGHGTAIAAEDSAMRGPRRDALTVLDESGVWVASRSRALPQLLRERAWQALFWEARADAERDMAFIVVGHALLEKALTPYPAMTGKCLVLLSDTLDPDALDATAARELAQVARPRALPPLPVQGIPRWDPANASAGYYANAEIFRPLREAPVGASGNALAGAGR
ncbi:MAG: DUF3025 domain-containing protein [Thiobacillus sp.]